MKAERIDDLQGRLDIALLRALNRMGERVAPIAWPWVRAIVTALNQPKGGR